VGFKRLLAGMGAGGASVETILQSPHVQPGGIVRGDIHLFGGQVRQHIERVTLALSTRVEVEAGDSEYQSTVEFQRKVAWGAFEIAPDAKYTVPFELEVPWETPLTAVQGWNLHGMGVGVRTELEIARAVDKGDLDAIAVHPLPSQQLILDALGRLGFRFRRADLESGRIRGVPQTLPFYQEIEFAPGPNYRGLNELELTFLAGPRQMHVVLEADKKGGLFTEGRDAFHTFVVDHATADRTDWASVMHGWLSEVGRKRGW
jgi:sporulation-control protein